LQQISLRESQQNNKNKTKMITTATNTPLLPTTIKYSAANNN